MKNEIRLSPGAKYRFMVRAAAIGGERPYTFSLTIKYPLTSHAPPLATVFLTQGATEQFKQDLAEPGMFLLHVPPNLVTSDSFIVIKAGDSGLLAEVNIE